MLHRRAAIALLSACFSSIALPFHAAADAASFTISPVTITVPLGFEGPLRQEMQDGITAGFAKPGPARTSTLLQVTVYDFGARLKSPKYDERAAASAKYLSQFAGGVQRRRSGYQQSAIESLSISSIPASRLTWTGKLQGVDTVGVMYCFVVGTRVVSFHTQDVGAVPTLNMLEAVRAFETAQVLTVP